jgi:hypothetical protein
MVTWFPPRSSDRSSTRSRCLNATSNNVTSGRQLGIQGRLLAESDRFVHGGGPLMVARADSAGLRRGYATQ